MDRPRFPESWIRNQENVICPRIASGAKSGTRLNREHCRYAGLPWPRHYLVAGGQRGSRNWMLDLIEGMFGAFLLTIGIAILVTLIRSL
jgi:hypothetical protein